MKDGKVDLDKVIKMAESLFGAGEKFEITKSIAIECQDGKDPDRCQATTNIYGCSIESSKKHGFDMKDFI